MLKKFLLCFLLISSYHTSIQTIDDIIGDILIAHYFQNEEEIESEETLQKNDSTSFIKTFETLKNLVTWCYNQDV